MFTCVLCSETWSSVRSRSFLRQSGETGRRRVRVRLQGNQQVRLTDRHGADRQSHASRLITCWFCVEDKRPAGGAEGHPDEDGGGRPVHRHPRRSAGHVWGRRLIRAADAPEHVHGVFQTFPGGNLKCFCCVFLFQVLLTFPTFNVVATVVDVNDLVVILQLLCSNV